MKKSRLTNPVSATKKAVSNCLSVTCGFVVGITPVKNKTSMIKLKKDQIEKWVEIKNYT